MDEMERHLADLSMRYAYLFLIVSLVAYEVFHGFHGAATNFISFVLSITVLIQLGSYQWFKHRADPTDQGPKQVLVSSIVLIVVILMLGIIGLGLMFHGK